MLIPKFLFKSPSGRSSGQVLVEYVLVSPILILILVAGFGVGMAMYQAHMASDAVKAPALKKLEMAQNPNCISADDLKNYIDNGNLRGSLNVGPYVDKVSIKGSGNYVRVLVGEKKIVPVASFLPTFDVKAIQVVNKNLLMATEATVACPDVTDNPPPCYPDPENGGSTLCPMSGIETGINNPVSPRVLNTPWVPYDVPNPTPW